MAADQKMARINVDDETWTRLRMHALQVNRSVADYLGELIRRDIGHHAPQIDEPRPPTARRPIAAAPAPAQPRDRKPQRAKPATSMWIPPWEI